MTRKRERKLSELDYRPDLSEPFPPEVEAFGALLCKHFGCAQRFWAYRPKNFWLDPLEVFLCDLLVIRARRNFFWSRGELESVLGHSAGQTHKRYKRIERIETESPLIWRAAHKVEGELGPAFIEQLMREDTGETIMEASKQIEQMRNL